jgi:ribosome modulation factor
MMPLSAYDIGWDAFFQDKEYDENPYKPRTANAEDWYNGWLDAEEDDARGKEPVPNWYEWV